MIWRSRSFWKLLILNVELKIWTLFTCVLRKRKKNTSYWALNRWPPLKWNNQSCHTATRALVLTFEVSEEQCSIHFQCFIHLGLKVFRLLPPFYYFFIGTISIEKLFYFLAVLRPLGCFTPQKNTGFAMTTYRLKPHAVVARSMGQWFHFFKIASDTLDWNVVNKKRLVFPQ